MQVPVENVKPRCFKTFYSLFFFPPLASSVQLSRRDAVSLWGAWCVWAQKDSRTCKKHIEGQGEKVERGDNHRERVKMRGAAGPFFPAHQARLHSGASHRRSNRQRPAA